MKETKYNLQGLMVVTHWRGGQGWKWLDIHTDEKGYKEIKKDPLQDYIQFGVQSVDYVQFDVYKSTIETKKDRIITTRFLEPIADIEVGDYPDKLQEQIDADFGNETTIHY